MCFFDIDFVSDAGHKRDYKRPSIPILDTKKTNIPHNTKKLTLQIQSCLSKEVVCAVLSPILLNVSQMPLVYSIDIDITAQPVAKALCHCVDCQKVRLPAKRLALANE